MYFCPSKRKLLVNDAIESKYIHIIHTTIRLASSLRWAASQRRRAKVAPPNIQRTDTLQVGDSLQMGDSCKGKGAADSLQQDTVAAAPPKKDALDAP